MQPFDAYALRKKVFRAAGTKCDDVPDSLVPADVGRHGGLAEEVVHVGMADTGAGEFYEHFIEPRGRDWDIMSDLDAGVGAGRGKPGGGLSGFGGIHCLKVVREGGFSGGEEVVEVCWQYCEGLNILCIEVGTGRMPVFDSGSREQLSLV